jgi:hypothetical protein
MPRRARVLWWSASVLAVLGFAAIGSHQRLQATATACRTSRFACEDAKYVARRLCSLHFPRGCRTLDDIYSAEFRDAEARYQSCGENETYLCMNAQRFRDEAYRGQTAEAAGRLCQRGNASACAMLAIYYRDGLGVPLNRVTAARTFGIACDLGAAQYCARAAAMYFEHAARLSYRATLAEMKASADRHADRGPPDVQLFYVLGAKLADAKPLQPNGIDHELLRQKGEEYDPNSLVPGESLVLSIRTFYPGPGMITDRETFEKVSLEIPSLRIGVPVNLAGADVHFYYAEGSGPWSPTAGHSFAKQARGTLTIRSVDEGQGILKARIDLVAQPVLADCTESGVDLDAKELHGEFSFARKNLGELSAWLGGKKAGLRNFP